jgi:hypothetical protein
METDFDDQDDWDGATYEEMSSGPDDDAIERAQEDEYQRYQKGDAEAEDEERSNDPYGHLRQRTYSDGTRQGSRVTKLPQSGPPKEDFLKRPHSQHYHLDNKDEVTLFLKYATHVGAKVLKILENEPNPDYVDDGDDLDGEFVGFSAYSVTVTSPVDVNLYYFRSGMIYESGEKQRIIDSYLSWMHVDQIAFRHKRSPTAIWSILTEAGCAFYQRAAYKNPDEEYVEPDKVAAQSNGFQTCRALERSLLTGRCQMLPNKPLELEWIDEKGLGFFHMSELPTADQKKIISFVASAISLGAALELSQRLNHHFLSYCIARQLDSPEDGLGALDKDTCSLNENLSQTRRDIECFYHKEALSAIEDPLAEWFWNEAYRFDRSGPRQSAFETRSKRFLTLYKLSSVSRGFEIPDDILFVVAALCRDYGSIELLATKDNLLAKWHCHEHTRIDAMKYSTDDAYPGSDLVLENRSDWVTSKPLLQYIQDLLPIHSRCAAFIERRMTYVQLRAKQQHARSRRLEAIFRHRWETESANRRAAAIYDGEDPPEEEYF